MPQSSPFVCFTVVAVRILAVVAADERHLPALKSTREICSGHESNNESRYSTYVETPLSTKMQAKAQCFSTFR